MVAVPTVLVRKVTYKVWSVFNFSWLAPPTKIKYNEIFAHEIFAIYGKVILICEKDQLH